MQNKLNTVSETSKVLGVNNNAVYALIKSGHLQALKLGSLKVPTSELDDFIKRNIGKDFSDIDNVTDLEYSK